MLPTGKVLFWDSYSVADNPRLWDPNTNAVTSATQAGYNIFCTGFSFLADGRLFVAGGHVSDNVGLAYAYTYNPFTNSWSRHYSAAFGINSSGYIVGTSNTGTVVRAFVWTSSGGMQDLGTLPNDNGSEAFDINNSGDIVGTSSGPAGVRAVVWRASGGIQNLGTLPGGDWSKAIGINASGQIVGTSGSSSGTHAFLWTSAGGMQDLGTLPVGTSTNSSGTHAFLWTSALGMVDLNTLISPALGLVLSEAHCINDTGQIAALTGGGHEVEHYYRVFLLTPPS